MTGGLFPGAVNLLPDPELLARHAAHRAKRQQRIAAVVVGVVAALVLAGYGVLIAARSDAAVVGVSHVQTVVVGGYESQTLLNVRTNKAVRGKHAASIWVTYPGDKQATRIGRGVWAGKVVTVEVRVDGDRTRWGHVNAVARDDVDGKTKPFKILVLRRSAISIDKLVPAGCGVGVTGSVRAWTPQGWQPSRYAVVNLYGDRGDRWIRVATVKANEYGLFSATFRGQGEVHAVKAVRVQSKTASPALSDVVEVGGTKQCHP